MVELARCRLDRSPFGSALARGCRRTDTVAVQETIPILHAYRGRKSCNLGGGAAEVIVHALVRGRETPADINSSVRTERKTGVERPRRRSRGKKSTMVLLVFFAVEDGATKKST